MDRSRTLVLCALTDIPDGHARGFRWHGDAHDRVFVVRRGDQYVAWMNRCPHRGFEGTSLPWRKDAYLTQNFERIQCSGHGAQFDVISGECVVGACRGQSLTAADVRLDSSGQLIWYDNNE